MELKIEYLPVKALKPYDKNTRKHAENDVDNIASLACMVGKMALTIGLRIENRPPFLNLKSRSEARSIPQ